MVWDCIYDEIQAVTLGSCEPNYFTGLSSDAAKIERVVTEDGGLMAEKVKGILNGMKTQLRLQNTVSEKFFSRIWIRNRNFMERFRSERKDGRLLIGERRMEETGNGLQRPRRTGL